MTSERGGFAPVTPTLTVVAPLAQEAIDVLTGFELSPDTRDLLVLEGVARATWAGEEELVAIVDGMLEDYERRAIYWNAEEARKAIYDLRASINA